MADPTKQTEQKEESPWSTMGEAINEAEPLVEKNDKRCIACRCAFLMWVLELVHEWAYRH